nr:exonuclease SbcCD subunit D [uncultured Ligilactobacillus sp.]
MKFLHTADWHIGKKLHDFSLFDSQQEALKQIEHIAKEEQVDAIVIAGDLYDRSVPSEEAIKMLNQALMELNLNDHFPILMINGNHDSAIRLDTGSQWFKKTKLFLNTKLKDAFTPIEIKDTQFFLLPYFEIPVARDYFEDDSIQNLAQAMKKIVAKMKMKFNNDKKHVLVTHFFAAGSTHKDSETNIEVGGLDAVPLDIMNDFDYVALGHLHSKNALHDEKMKYSGSPVKFSVSEANDTKGVWIVDTDQPVGKMTKWIPLKQKHEIQILNEDFETLISPQMYQKIPDEDFVAVELTDKEIIPNIMNRLREFYPRIISFKRQNGREIIEQEMPKEIKKLSPVEMLEMFFEESTGHILSKEQLDFAEKVLTELERSDS